MLDTVWSFTKGICQDLVDVTRSVPPEANRRIVEARLTTDEQRARRKELVNALRLAATLQDDPSKQSVKEAKGQIDHRLTVQASLSERYLIEPEIFDFTTDRGVVYIARPGLMQLLFSGGLGSKAKRERMEIAEGMRILAGPTMTSIEGVVKDDEERMEIVRRARAKGYNMSIIFTLAILALLSTAQMSDARAVRAAQYDFTPNVVDTSIHADRHVAMFNMPLPVRSTHLHEIAVERHQAKGMWFPSHPIPHLIQRHANSVSQKPLAKQETVKTTDAKLNKDWVALPDTFSGKEEESFDILQAHGYDVATLYANLVQTSSLAAFNSSTTFAERANVNALSQKSESVLQTRFAIVPALIYVGIVAGNFLAGVGVAAGCKAVIQGVSQAASDFLCFGLGFLLGSLGTWGSVYTRLRLISRAASAANGQQAAEIAMEAINVVQAFGVGGSSRKRSTSTGVEKHWFEDHFDLFQEMYADSLEMDRMLDAKGDSHLDAQTGDPLTVWDVIMAHVHPVRHAMHQGLNSSFWLESKDKDVRQHGFVSFSNAPTDVQVHGQSFSFAQPIRSSLHKRQCEQSDAETTFDESPSENWCEEGQSVGAEGVYTSYQLPGTDQGEDDSAHLKLGNDSYAFEMAKLEGELAYLGGVTNVCENVTYENMPIFLGMHQVEFPGDETAGFDTCG